MEGIKSTLFKAGLVLGLLFFINQVARADVKLPALIGDNMVLQRDASIKVWGWADPGEKITLEFLSKKQTVKTGKDGKWTMVLSPLPAGGPYEMVIKGKNTITIKNILVGDVWLASGQSNMEFQLKDVINSKQEIESANIDEIRLNTIARSYALKPKQSMSSAGWDVCSQGNATNFSAVAYLFGRELYLKYMVPIGIIHSSWGGTYIELWTSTDGLKDFPELTKPLKEFKPEEISALEIYQEKWDSWYNEFGAIDRGRLQGKTSWTDPELNTDGWVKMKQPGIWSTTKELKGYAGVVWFRKEINIPADLSGNSAEISLGNIFYMDSVFVNGQFVGSSSGYGKKRVYKIPSDLLNAGSNVIVVRVLGNPGIGGISGSANNLFVQSGLKKIPLAGDWLYKTGPDISTLPEEVTVKGINKIMPQVPTLLYNAMIAPLVPYSIKGAIWYQGESNADNMEEALQYYSLFPAMINDWRKQWGYDFPFLFVQLAGYQPDNAEPSDYAWAHLREAQSQTLSLPNTGMAAAIDIGEVNDIHPKNKQDVAHRLFLAAEKVAYNKDVVFSGPTFKRMKVEGDKIRLSFDNLGTGLLIKNKYGYISGFAIAGADKKFVWAKAFQEGTDVIVYADDVVNPEAVRYNWGNSPDGNLYNKENLPAVPFRTDDW